MSDEKGKGKEKVPAVSAKSSKEVARTRRKLLAEYTGKKDSK